MWRFPGQGTSQSFGCWPTPQPWQCQIRAAFATCITHSSRQRRILNPLIEVRDRTRLLMDTSQICFHCTTMGTPSKFIFPDLCCLLLGMITKLKTFQQMVFSDLKSLAFPKHIFPKAILNALSSAIYFLLKQEF